MCIILRRNNLYLICEVRKPLKMNFEFRKGLLFIRLKGVLNKENSKELSSCLDQFIHEKGVRYFVINLENLEYLDKDGLDVIQNKYEDMILHNGKLVICGYQNEYVKTMVEEEMSGVYNTQNELAAFNMIQI